MGGPYNAGKNDKTFLKDLIDASQGRIPADLLLLNVKVADVLSGEIRDDDIAVYGGRICGFGRDREALEKVDCGGLYAAPGLMDSHIHVESTCTSPEEFGRLVVPRGTTTVIADPHEIVNVCGLNGFNYMIRAAERTELSIRYMMPSCVPATPFDDSGAVLNAFDMKWPMQDSHVPGLGEFMNYPGILSADEECMNKLLTAGRMGKTIDGHAPFLSGMQLDGYTAAGIKTDHESGTLKELKEKISRGMYIAMRDGSACHDLEKLIPGITRRNLRRLTLCSDDRQPKTILEEGHIDSHLRKLVRSGIDPVDALTMATINTAECYGLSDRGALVPGRRADIVLFEDLSDFRAKRVYIEGKLCAEDGKYVLPVEKCSIASVRGSMHVRDFSEERLVMHLKSPRVRAVRIIPGGITTGESHIEVRLDEQGDFVFDPGKDVVKAAVLERHHSTGQVGLGLLEGYGIKHGAIALSVAHDTHNIICVGVSNKEMAHAIKALIDQEGGFVTVRDGKVLASLPLPIAGLMSDMPGEWVAEQLGALHESALKELGVSDRIDPVMTLCFMSLIVIPDLKLTARGLFDVKQFRFVPTELG